jgi:hypothetical protein
VQETLFELFPYIEVITTSSPAFAIGDLLIGALLLLFSAGGRLAPTG